MPEVQEQEAKSPNSLSKPLSIKDILAAIPHRYPFILVDRVTELEPGVAIKGYKNVTINEPFFQGHFPGEPIMPGVLQLEAMAQLGVVLMSRSGYLEGKLAVFAGMNDVRFRRMVVPGDCFEMECKVTRFRAPIGKMACVGRVNGEVAVEAEIICSLVDTALLNGKD